MRYDFCQDCGGCENHHPNCPSGPVHEDTDMTVSFCVWNIDRVTLGPESMSIRVNDTAGENVSIGFESPAAIKAFADHLNALLEKENQREVVRNIN